MRKKNQNLCNKKNLYTFVARLRINLSFYAIFTDKELGM